MYLYAAIGLAWLAVLLTDGGPFRDVIPTGPDYRHAGGCFALGLMLISIWLAIFALFPHRKRIMPYERTGWVKVTMVNQSSRVVNAESFGAAAAMIHCRPQQIARFAWVNEPLQ